MGRYEGKSAVITGGTTPNANVLIELGYTMKSLGTMERVVLVMNTTLGDDTKLPFEDDVRRVG
jgi:hypothetical protein